MGREREGERGPTEKKNTIAPPPTHRLSTRLLSQALTPRHFGAAVARARVHDPDLLLCDEPTAALDARSGHQVMELLRSVAVRPGRVVIVVSHDQRVFGFANRIAEMDDGVVVRVEDRIPTEVAYPSGPA